MVHVIVNMTHSCRYWPINFIAETNANVYIRVHYINIKLNVMDTYYCLKTSYICCQRKNAVDIFYIKNKHRILKKNS